MVPSTSPIVNIFPGQKRLLDAIAIQEDWPDKGNMHLITDSSLAHVHCVGSGTYLLEYRVVSVNFPEIRACFRLTLGGSFADVRFERTDCDGLENKEYPRKRLQFVRRIVKDHSDLEE
jgi:hypothetical protein